MYSTVRDPLFTKLREHLTEQEVIQMEQLLEQLLLPLADCEVIWYKNGITIRAEDE